jgi:hypothetical protein
MHRYLKVYVNSHFYCCNRNNDLFDAGLIKNNENLKGQIKVKKIST